MSRRMRVSVDAAIIYYSRRRIAGGGSWALGFGFGERASYNSSRGFRVGCVVVVVVYCSV